MPKVKMPRKSTHVDMTAMCDVAFLLLTFFMLTTKFKPVEPVTVVTPASISTKLLPESNILLITIGKGGRVFFSMDNKPRRAELIKNISDQYHLGLTQDDINAFAIGGSIGVPFNQLKNFLDLPPDQQKSYNQPGIPIDSSNNELDQWIKYALNVNNGNGDLAICVKADQDTKYPVIKQVLKTLKDNNQYKLHLVTDIKPIPKGTPAYLEQQANRGKADKNF
jgi:biopolymer transport protein ExbD